jgi:predicted acylesterase/phospholipase RssA
VAIVALHAGAPAPAVAAAIRRALPDRCRVAEPERVDVAELERAERDHDRVFLVADDPDSEWAQFCIRQADFLILVGRADAPVEHRTRLQRPELVLVGGKPSSEVLTAWSDATGTGRITCADDDDLPSSLRPLASRIAGESLGVVLAGGGARSLVQIGVLQELLDAGLHIDRVAGCSMGSIIGGLLACGLDGELLERVVYAEVVRRSPVGDYTLPRTSLFRGRRLDDAIERSFADAPPIEALPRWYRCVSTDLRSRARVVHERGDIKLAIRASSSIPGVFPPVRTSDQLLVDGGILDNMPVDLLTDTNEGPVIAVNVAMGGGAADQLRHPGGRVEPRMPGLGETLLRTMLISSSGASEDARRAGAYVVTPRAEHVGLLEFHQFDALVEAGRAAARELLELTGGHFERSVIE